MTYAVRVPDEYVWLMGRFVSEGQSIVPGVPLMDVMTPEGVVETIISECWGIVAHVEGHRVFRNEDIDLEDEEDKGDDEDESDDGENAQRRSSSGGMSAVFSKGDVICHIVAREQHGTRKSGLYPRPAPSVRYRRLMGISR